MTNPYLIQTLLPRLDDTQACSIIQDFQAKLSLHEDNPIIGLFEYGWNAIPENWKPVLAALADLERFISDAFSIAAEMNDDKQQSPGRELCNLLSIPKVAKMSEILEAGTKAGFFIARPS